MEAMPYCTNEELFAGEIAVQATSMAAANRRRNISLLARADRLAQEPE
jgi:hypothetical protein